VPKILAQLLCTPRLYWMILLGFSSGLPLSLCGGLLEARYTTAGVSLVAIGFASLVGLPYTLKFLWAPLIDRYHFSFLGRRRGWMLFLQLSLIVFIGAMALFDAKQTPFIVAALAVVVAFLSASQDIVIDAYRTDILPDNERGIASALFVGAYRMAMVIAGGVGFILADHLGWQVTYFIMAALMLVGVFGTIISQEPVLLARAPSTLQQAVVEPWREFFSRGDALLILALLICYKAGDAFAAKMLTPFLLREIGASMTEIGVINKTFGLTMTMVGAFVGGVVLLRCSLWRALMWFGLLQAVSNLVFIYLAWIGYDRTLIISSIAIENFTGGLGTAAFMALLMSLCDHRYSAFQFALFSSLTSVPREFLGPITGWVAQNYGWVNFFIISTFVALPGLFLLWCLKDRIDSRSIAQYVEKTVPA